MTAKRPSAHEQARERRIRQAHELDQAASQLPGVADLIRLYEQHAATVRKTQAYLTPAGRTSIITSGAASA